MRSKELTREQQRELEEQLAETRDARVYRRTLAVLEWSRGVSSAEIAKRLGVSRQSVSNWVRWYQRSGAPTVLADEARSGRPPIWSPQLETQVVSLLASRPQDHGYLAGSWTIPLLRAAIKRTLGLSCSDDTLRRGLHRLGYVWKRARYVLEPDPNLEEKKKRFGTPSVIFQREQSS